ncbi:MAG: DUF6089 family protein [Reichenbachiella sp.]|uniref:DUF6089 family protein n=1 Tax=Reichenbachiella sp. TaxID=2184521 RepID=UPI0032658CF5
MRYTNFLFIVVALVLPEVECLAQDSLQRKKKEIHFGLGPASYSGDLGNAYSSSSLMVNFGLKLNKEKKLNGNIKVSIGRVTGQELDYTTTDNSGAVATPNTFFKSTFFGLNYEVQYNLIDKDKIKVYLSQGIGFFRFEPQDQSGQSLVDQTDTRPLGETYRNLTIQLPAQIGAKYYLSNDFGVGIQVGFVNPITDHLDNLGVWGNKNGNDNILSIQFQIHVPISF